MKTDIIPFDFEGAAVRVLDQDGQPWFVAKDVFQVLGLVWKGSNNLGPLSDLEEDEKATRSVGTLGGQQSMIVVNESGLYALIFRSRKPAAKRFRKWVTAEVLPALRRTGRYAMPGAPAEDDTLLAPGQAEERGWTSKINLALRVYGQQAARELWEQSPLPKPSAVARAAAAAESDGRGCLAHLLSFQTADLDTLAEIVALTKVSERACGRLAYFGLRVDVGAYDGALVVADAHPVLMAIFAGSRWEHGWRRALLAIPGAQATHTIPFRRIRSCAVAIPFDVLDDAAGVEG